MAAFINTKPTTKRTLLQTFARIYHPLGFLAPITVRAVVIFQDLWKLRHPWDSSLQPGQFKQTLSKTRATNKIFQH
ncbi:hypothetical protein HPB48_015415 [Haemaphysalis longicornis]|uniref:Uncharacterized protein n=1 Tax=Haemaphysalis longicornis TaxID=44386 RepID=A0A9J6GAG8_HAELO|nr:hypothetical protein HPB48_015415 [Haemaphysalis longicornis]